MGDGDPDRFRLYPWQVSILRRLDRDRERDEGPRFVPLSVRYGSRWTRLKWWLTRWRTPVALWIAPWLRGPR